MGLAKSEGTKPAPPRSERSAAKKPSGALAVARETPTFAKEERASRYLDAEVVRHAQHGQSGSAADSLEPERIVRACQGPQDSR